MNTAVTAERIYVVITMSRSGHNAVINWIARQSEQPCLRIAGLRMQVPNDTPLDLKSVPQAHEYWWYERGRPGVRNDQRWSDANSVSVKTLILSYEDRWPEDVGRYNGDLPLGSVRYVVIVRDYLNWISSHFKRNRMVTDEEIQQWVASAELLINDPTVIPICFDHWFSNLEARKDIAQRLGIDFNDVGLNDVIDIGGGSSWNATTYNGRAQEMDVLFRWMEFYESKKFSDLAWSNKKAIEINHRLFGKLHKDNGVFPTTSLKEQ
jgi:hypothetical protein